jgi:putative molybdopterin biosynthesis protein
MFSQLDTNKVYTPEQVAAMLQLSKNTIYELINRGEIVAKKIGKVYRIPATSLSFMFTGLDYDLYQAEQADLPHLKRVEQELEAVRADKA